MFFNTKKKINSCAVTIWLIIPLLLIYLITDNYFMIFIIYEIYLKESWK